MIEGPPLDFAGPEEELEDGSYLASLSDLMVGMLFIFIIMLMAFALSYSKATIEASKAATDASKAATDASKAATDAERARQAAENRSQALNCLLTKNQEQLSGLLFGISESFNAAAGEEARMQVDESKTVLRMEDSVLFDSGISKLRDGGIEAVESLAKLFDEKLPCYVGAGDRPPQCAPDSASIIEGIYIEGHTDNDPIRGPGKDNWDLSTERATETFRTLTNAKVALLDMRNAQNQVIFGVSGYGEQRPLNQNLTEFEKQKNRRIDIRFTLRAPTVKEVEKVLKDADNDKTGC